MNNSADLYFVIIYLAILVMGVYLIPKLRTYYFNNRITKIYKANQKQIFCKGKIQKFNTLLTAPLSKKECCGYIYMVCDRQTTIYTYTIISSQSQVTDFILEDESGSCLIRPKNVGQFCESKEWPPTIFFSRYRKLEDAIKHDDLSPTTSTIGGRKNYQHIEYRRQPGEIVYINGFFQPFSKDINLSYYGLRGEIVESKNPLNITPAYKGIPVITHNVWSSLEIVWIYIKSIFS